VFEGVKARLHNRPKGLFLHIQKTAGSSIVQIARQHYGTNMSSHGDHVGKIPADMMALDFVSGHFGYDFAKPLLNDRYSFTFLREPKQRILSMYYYLRGEKDNLFPIGKLAKKLSLQEFLKLGFTDSMVMQRLWNNQAWQLAYGWENSTKKQVQDFAPDELLAMASVNLESFSHVGFTDNFETSRDIILQELGIPIPEEKVVANVSQNSSKPDLSDEVLELLDALTEVDRKLYAIAKTSYDILG